MKWVSEDFKNLREMFVFELRMMLSAEEQLVRSLPNMEIGQRTGAAGCDPVAPAGD